MDVSVLLELLVVLVLGVIGAELVRAYCVKASHPAKRRPEN